MQQGTAPTTQIQKNIETHLHRLNDARVACDRAEQSIEVAEKYGTQHEMRLACARRNEAYKNYLEVTDWLLIHTPHGFFFDEIAQAFKLS